MSRPVGEPGTLAAGSRSMAAAAGALEDVRGRLRGATSFVVVAGAWRGPASQAFLIDGAGLQTSLDRTTDALDQAAGALSELAARLEQAQSTWDRAQRLAATVGVDLRSGAAPPTGRSDHLAADGRALSPAGEGGWVPGGGVRSPAGGSGWVTGGGVRSPADAIDPAAMLVGGEAARMAAAAEHEAAAARRTAAARLDQAAALVPARSPALGQAAAGGREEQGGRPPGGLARHPESGNGHGGNGPGEDRHGGGIRGAVGRALEAGAEVATATHHLVVAAEARVEAAGRLATTADDPAVRAAAGRVAEAAARPMVDGRALGALPLVAPILDFTGAVSHGEPLPRALAGAIGAAVGADLGGRVGMAACGGEAAATQGAGLIVCPTLAAVGGALGAQAGKAAALHVYDKIAGPPDDPTGPVKSGSRSGSGPGSGG